MLTRIKDWNKSISKANSLHCNHICKMDMCLKLATNIQAATKQDIKPTQEINDLIVCLLAHLRYLQEDFTSVIVTGKCSDTTQGIFSNYNRI